MNPKQLEKVIEELKEWKKSLNGSVGGAELKTVLQEANVGVKSVGSHVEVVHPL